MLEEGQRLILTGEFGYFFVEGNDVLAPEQPAITDRPDGFEHPLQNGETLMLELTRSCAFCGFSAASILMTRGCAASAVVPSVRCFSAMPAHLLFLQHKHYHNLGQKATER